MSYLGIDIGTSGTKAVVFDADGRQLAQAYREYPTLMPAPGHAELDPELVMNCCLEVVSEAAACAAADPVLALGVSSQGEAFTVLGADSSFLTNAMVSFDTRAAALAKSWSAEFGARELYERTGHTAHPMFSLFKLLWIRENLPEVWSKAVHLYCFEELFQHTLGLAEPAVSRPLAARTMLFNLREHDWDETILSAVGLRRGQLARPLPSGTIVGKVPLAMARRLNLAETAVVVAGGHDQPAGALGAGVTSPGKAVYGMGTVDCICPAFSQPVFSDRLFSNNLCTYDFTLDGMYTTVAFSLTGGNLTRWYRDQLAGTEVREAHAKGLSPFEVMYRDFPERPTKLMVLPHFTPTGTPYFDTDARGAILGLQLSTTKEEILRALIEGVALEMKLNLQILEHSGCRIDEFMAIGGGSRERAVMQLKADVLNRPITTVAVTEAGCLGLAILGCAAVTGEAPAEIAGRWVRHEKVVRPNPENAGIYEQNFTTYKELYPALKKLRLKD